MYWTDASDGYVLPLKGRNRAPVRWDRFERSCGARDALNRHE
jgi:hypothetical protein